ncbi:MAG: Rieske 2Fe-2S domain-containing protein [Anaerolineales bacterium]|nr:Rieske 2Fe-2S domain-containing protein [Anaerolineales bacterium]
MQLKVSAVFNYKELPQEKLEFVAVATVDEIDHGERLIFEIEGVSIVVFNLAGKYFAIADVCSHDDGPVAEGELDGNEIECPRHGARFHLESGKALTLPAVVDIPAYPVRIEGDEILVGLPLDA